MLNKLRLKFVLINMCIVVAMLLVIFATVYHFTSANLEQQGTAMLRTLSQNTRQPNAPPNANPEVQLPYFTIQVHINGDVYVSGHSYFDLNDETFIQTLIQKVYRENTAEGYIPEYALRYSVVSSMGLQKLIFLDISSQSTTLRSLIKGCIMIGIASILAFLGISFLLSYWAVKPVEKAWNQQQQFVSDASHELKTPLTVIMSNAELLQSSDNEAENKAQFVNSIVAMSQRMRTLVDGLLQLTRADNGTTKQAFEPIDISRIASEALLPFEPVLFEKGLLLESNIEPNLTINGSALQIQQLLGILLDNAGKYANPGIVTFAVQRQGRNILLTVANPGDPIPKADLERIFDRFYRADAARTGNGSFGLGLSIAKSITHAHGGRIWAQSNITGNCFYVQLPMQ